MYRATETQKQRIWDDYEQAIADLDMARERLDSLTDALGEASDNYTEAKEELAFLREQCQRCGVFDDE